MKTVIQGVLVCSLLIILLVAGCGKGGVPEAFQPSGSLQSRPANTSGSASANAPGNGATPASSQDASLQAVPSRGPVNEAVSRAQSLQSKPSPSREMTAPTDAELEAAVADRLSHDDAFEHTRIFAKVRQSEVVLKGEVDSKAARELAEVEAAQATGLGVVRNELVVRGSGAPYRAPAENFNGSRIAQGQPGPEPGPQNARPHAGIHVHSTPSEHGERNYAFNVTLPTKHHATINGLIVLPPEARASGQQPAYGNQAYGAQNSGRQVTGSQSPSSQITAHQATGPRPLFGQRPAPSDHAQLATPNPPTARYGPPSGQPRPLITRRGQPVPQLVVQ